MKYPFGKLKTPRSYKFMNRSLHIILYCKYFAIAASMCFKNFVNANGYGKNSCRILVNNASLVFKAVEDIFLDIIIGGFSNLNGFMRNYLVIPN